jgi:sugar lactone lactonase YvrE
MFPDAWLQILRPVARRGIGKRRIRRRRSAHPLPEVLEERRCPSGGYLLIGSFGTDSVPRYDESTGAFVDTFVTHRSGGLTSPEGLVFGPHDHDLYVTSGFEGGPGQNPAVMRYDGTTGAFLGVFAGGGHLNAPVSVLFGPDGNLYVADHGNNVVYRYDGTTGAFKDLFIPAGSGGLGGPLGMVFAPDGKNDGKLDLYIANHDTHNILRYNGTTGAPDPSPGNTGATYAAYDSGTLNHPLDLKFGPDGNLYVTNAGRDFNPNASVLRFQGPTGASPGAFIGTFVSPGSGGLLTPDGLIFGPDGNGDGRQDLYVSSIQFSGASKAVNGTSSVLRYDGVTGAFIDTFVTPDSGGLRGDDFLTFTETDPTTLAYTGTTDTWTAAAVLAPWPPGPALRGIAPDSATAIGTPTAVLPLAPAPGSTGTGDGGCVYDTAPIGAGVFITPGLLGKRHRINVLAE